MKLESRFSLHQLMAFSLGSSFTLPLFLLIFVLRGRFGQIPSSFSGRFLAFGLTLVLPSLICVFASLGGIRAVRRGLMDDLWPASDIDKELQALQSRTLSWTTKGLLLLGATICFAPLLFQAHGPHTVALSGMIYFFSAPTMTHTELLKLLSPSKPSQVPTMFADMKPIVSAHWGDGGVSDSL